MTCRREAIGSAVTSFVHQRTSLNEQQVLSLYHELMREGANAETDTSVHNRAVINSLHNAVIRDTHLSPARRASILNRLDLARTGSPTSARLYATERLMDRARRAETALNDYVAHAARDMGISEDDVRARIATGRTAASEDRSVRAPASAIEALRENHPSLPLDRHTAYAIAGVEEARRAAQASQPTRPTVTRETITGSSAVRELGFDVATGRTEVVMHSNPDRVYAYRLSAQQFEEFRNAASIGAYYADYIRGNPDHLYDNNDEATTEGTQTQCATCGQFAGQGHSCPPRGSAEEAHVTAARARRAVRARATERRATRARAAGEARQNLDETPVAPVAPVATVTAHGSQRTYSGDSGTFRTPSLSGVRSQSRSQPVLVPVRASVFRTATPEGGSIGIGHALLRGNVQVHYDRATRSYVATNLTNPNRRLACTCTDYRRDYDCVHVRQAMQDINTRMNQERLSERHHMGPALSILNDELVREHRESMEAQVISQTTWGESPVSYTSNNRAFQADYRAAKARQAAGEEPVPYMRENATDGLGARGTGRAFGVELEFDVESGRDRAQVLAAIGRRLRAEGLTRSAAQSRYHAAASRGYTEEHRGGWSFEADCTVAGEIVSPIMYDEPETWENIEKVCRIVREEGGIVSTRTGGHVHVSAHNYDHTVANHNRLLGSFAENEDTIYRLSSNPERGTHRGSNWCTPNRVPATGYRSVAEMSSRNGAHSLALNMQSVHGGASDHVEFRTYDASLNPSVIQTQIKMSLALTEAAFREEDYQPGAHAPLGSRRRHNRETHGESRRLTGEAWKQDTLGYREFADRLFRRPEDKAQLTALFAVTKWQRGGRGR
jgi:hypothetical protein